MQSLSTCAIITAPLGLRGCHGSPRSNITSPYMSPPTRIQNASTTLTLNSSRVVHSLISVLQLASNNIIPSSSATNSITKNANVEFAKLDLLTSSSLQQSTTKSLLSEMLKKQVEQRMNKNKLSPMQRKPIMILPTRRIKNTENIHTNNQGHNRVIDAKAKSLKFGNCPLVVRAQKDDFSVGNDTSVTESETGESSQDNTRKDNIVIVAATYSTVAARKTSFVTSASIIRAKNDDTNINIANVMSLKSTKLFSPPPMKKGVYNDEVEDSDDDGYIEDDEYEEEEEEDDDDDEEEEEEEEDNENEEYNIGINYGDHLSVLINSPASYRRTTSNYSTALSSLTPKPNMISENAANNNNHDNNPRHGTLGNATSHPMMPRKTKSFPPYNDSHPINWHMNIKKGIPIPQPSMSNLNTDYRHQHYRRKKHRYGKVGKNPEVMNDNREREGLREARNGEEGMFWPMSI